ncbi:MAG: hypothetical protein ABIT70_10435 [Sulfuriferula sp.]|jgi:intracellular sulfur oxidation DsrE/DsrF family protein
MKPEISQEQLNAFIDGELDLIERDRLFIALEDNPELAHELCELRAVKAMVCHGYEEPPQAFQKCIPRQFSISHYMATGLVLVLGLAVGWFGRDWHTPQRSLIQNHAKLQLPISLSGLKTDTRKIVLHIDSDQPVKVQTLLDDVDYLLQHQKVMGQPVQIEVIANNYGLDLLRADVTPYAARIEKLARQHANISFVACGQTMRRLDLEGVKVKLLPETRVAPTAIGEIINRLQHGWTYIKV